MRAIALISIARAYNNIGAALRGKGDLQEVRRFSIKVISIQEKIVNLNSPDLVLSCDYMGEHFKGNLIEALKVYKNTLPMKEKGYDVNNPDLAASQSNI